MDEGRLVHQAVKMMYGNRKEGDMIMDSPKSATWVELKNMAVTDKDKL